MNHHDMVFESFFDELEKIGLGTQILKPMSLAVTKVLKPARNFSLAGERAITKTPFSAITGGALKGQAGSLRNTILSRDQALRAASSPRDARLTHLQQLLSEGKFDPKAHDAAEFMRTGGIVAKKAPVIAPPSMTETPTQILKPSQIPGGMKPMATAAPAKNRLKQLGLGAGLATLGVGVGMGAGGGAQTQAPAYG